MKRKLTLLLTAFLLLTGMCSWGQMRTEASIDFSEQGYENAQDMDGVIIDIDENVTVVFNKASGSTSPKYYNSGTAIRAYGGNNFIVSSTGTISSITLTFGSSDGSNVITTEVGTFESPTWTGSESEVTFTIGGTSGNRRIKAIDVVYSSGGAPQQYVALPTFSPEAGVYFEPQTVTISCETVDATIHYTMDGSTPTEDSPVYSTALSIDETTTVKAKAWKNGYQPSPVATATYSITNLVTIAEARALALNEYALVQGIVNFIDGRNVYVQDATGGICLFLNNNTVPSDLALGDMVQAYGKRANYNGLAELSGINGGNSDEFDILSSGNTLPLVVKTIAEILEDGADALQCTRVKIESAILGATSGNNTPLTQGDDETIIYKMPTLTEIEAGDEVDVIGVVGYFNAPQIRVASASDIVLSEVPVVPDPTLSISVTQLNDFRYIFGAGPSLAKNFTVSGANLTSSVTLTAPQDFEISLNPENGYVDSDELSPVAGTLTETTIYVRMKAGLNPGSYTGNLSIVSGTLNHSIVLNGMVDVIPSLLTVEPLSLSGFEYEYEAGGPSEIQFITVGGDMLTHNVSILPSESFEVSTQLIEMFQPENPAMIYIPNTGHFYGIKIYVRLKAGLEVGTYNEQIVVASEDADTVFVNVAGTVTGDAPTPPTPPTPGDGNYVRINDLSQLAAGNYVVFAARFDGNATDYYAMSNSSSGKPTGVLFTSATANENEVLPASIVDEETSYYWIVGVTDNGYTFTNAAGELIGYTSSTNFATGGDNTEWTIEFGTAGDEAMVPNYAGFLISNVNNPVRHFALNSNHNFGPYHTNNLNNSGYNFYLDLFVKTEGGEPPVPPTPTVATPTFAPEAGTYFEEQSVSIACATDGATIYYSTVSENGPWTTYAGAIIVDESMTIWAYAEKEGYNDSPVASATYIIQLGVVTIFNQDWEGEMNGWTFVDVEGEMSWNIATYQGNHYAYANGYNHGANNDWCISPAFNLNAISNPVLSFRTAKNYTGPDLEVFFSNDYDGEDPDEATWIPLACALSSGSWAWTESGDINLGNFSGTNCYIGFKYTCEESSAAGWEVDDILLVGMTSEPVVTVTPLALTGFTYIEGNGPSAEQSFTVSGFNLSGNITITPSTDFEISESSGSGFAQAPIELNPVGGNVEETTIYVRLKAGLAVGNYNDEDITVTCADVDDIEVTCSGSVTAQPVPGDDYIRISDVDALAAGNRVILAARFNETADAYLAIANTPTSGKLTTTEFTSEMNGNDEIIPASILGDEDSYYWTVDITTDGYTFTNANGDMIGYGNSGTNLVLNGEKTIWTVSAGVSDPESMVPEYHGFNIINATTDTRAMALRVTETESLVKAYATSNMSNSEYNFFLDIFMQGEGGSCTVAAPTFTPAGGTYYETLDVTLSCNTAGATIYYSLDSENGPWEEYEEAITVDESMTLWAYATKEGCNDSPVVGAEYVIQNDLVIIFNQDWEEDWHGWTEVCVEGDSLWRIASYQGNHYAYANGYNHPATEDWLISPAFDLDSYDDVVLSFRTAMNYTGPTLEVFFSNDYDGQDPTAATWQELDCELSEGSWNWVESGEISLNEFSGTNCYIGFKYTCTDEEAAGWEVDDIMLVSGSATPTPTLTATPNTLCDFEYLEGEGPSESESYTLTGANLEGEGNISVTVNEYFEISFNNEAFGETLEIAYADGTLVDQPVTIYVRMVEGLEAGSYTGTIHHEGGNATTEVSLCGTVLSGNEPAILMEFMPLYIQGNNGSNNNRVPVAIEIALTNLEHNTTYRYTNQFVDDNDGPETAGAGNVIYANEDGFYRSTSPSLATEGNYGEFTTNEVGDCIFWFINEPTANARFTPGNHVYLRIRLNDGHDGTTVAHTFTTQHYATVLNFGNENDEYSGSAFYAKSDEDPMTFAMLYASPQSDWRPIYSTPVETTGVDFGNINQYADFYKESVAGNDGWFGGILPNDNETGINSIWIYNISGGVENKFETQDGQWYPDANTVNPNNGLDEPIFIDLTYDGIEETVETNVKVWSADHEFVIENGDNAHYSMTVYNVLGQPMMMKQINAGSTERISHSLASGIYVISLQNNQNTVSVKVIVK